MYFKIVFTFLRLKGLDFSTLKGLTIQNPILLPSTTIFLLAQQVAHTE